MYINSQTFNINYKYSGKTENSLIEMIVKQVSKNTYFNADAYWCQKVGIKELAMPLPEGLQR